MLETFCSNVYADDDGTTILEPVERIKDIKACKKNSLNVQNKFMSDVHACSHSTLGYLWDAIGITMPNSSNMLSEMLAITFFSFFNFCFLLDGKRGVDMAHFGHANR